MYIAGDPTVFGNFNVDKSANEAIARQLDTFKQNGYPPAHGTLLSGFGFFFFCVVWLLIMSILGTHAARDAVARKYSVPDKAPLTADDVILTNGCSGALEICFSVLCNPGTNILLPRPGFSLYASLAEIKYVEARFYDLVPERNWEADLEQMESLIDDKTAAILVNK